jgi:hypothetical protein
MMHDLRTIQARRDHGKGLPLWDWSRGTAWTRVAEVMKAAKVPDHCQPEHARHTVHTAPTRTIIQATTSGRCGLRSR